MLAQAAQARRTRLEVDLPRLLEAEEARTFEAAKRLEAAGYPKRAEPLFEASRQAFQARQAIRDAQAGRGPLEPALEQAKAVADLLSQGSPRAVGRVTRRP